MSSTKIIDVAITQAAGAIGYPFLFLLVQSNPFGKDTRINLHLWDIERHRRKLMGCALELTDVANEHINEIVTYDSIEQALPNRDFYILLNGFHQHSGMTKSKFVQINAEFYKKEAQVIGANYKEGAKIFVIGNPCNTNCLVLSKNAVNIPSQNIFGLSYLDELRARSFLAKAAGKSKSAITGLYAWGNHSSSIFADFENAKVGDQKLIQQLIKKVQGRGQQIIDEGDHSSAGSAAIASFKLIELLFTTSKKETFSLIVNSKNTYDIPRDLWVSLPCRMTNGKIEIIENIKHSKDSQQLIDTSIQEIISEKELVESFGLI